MTVRIIEGMQVPYIAFPISAIEPATRTDKGQTQSLIATAEKHLDKEIIANGKAHRNGRVCAINNVHTSDKPVPMRDGFGLLNQIVNLVHEAILGVVL